MTAKFEGRGAPFDEALPPLEEVVPHAAAGNAGPDSAGARDVASAEPRVELTEDRFLELIGAELARDRAKAVLDTVLMVLSTSGSDVGDDVVAAAHVVLGDLKGARSGRDFWKRCAEEAERKLAAAYAALAGAEPKPPLSLESAIAVVETQPFYPDTKVGTRQAWVKAEIVRRLRELAGGQP